MELLEGASFFLYPPFSMVQDTQRGKHRPNQHHSRLREIMMLHRLPTDDPPVGIVLQQRRQQVRGVVAPQRLHRHEVRDRPLRPLGKLRVEVRQPVHAVPVRARVRRPPPLEDLDELVDVRPAREEGEAGGHLGEDAPDGPDVDGGRVAGRAEEELGGAVPEGDDLVGVGTVGEAGEAGEAEVGEFERVSVGADQELQGENGIRITEGIVVRWTDASYPRVPRILISLSVSTNIPRATIDKKHIPLLTSSN